MMDRPTDRDRARRSTGISTRLLLVLIGGLSLPVIVWGALAQKHTAAAAEATIRSDLDRSGLDWAQVRVERGRALLTGRVPATGLGSRALDVARTSMCRGLFGHRPCVRTVRADYGINLRDDESWPELTASVYDGVLTLSGSVPDQASRATVLETARAALASPVIHRIEGDLTVSGASSPAGLRPLLRRVAAALTLCSQGRASVSDGRTNLQCATAPILADSVRYLLATPLPTGVLDVLDVTSPVPGPRS